jgi:hypothetical protein
VSLTGYVEIAKRADIRVQRWLHYFADVKDDPQIAWHGIADLIDRLANEEIDLAHIENRSGPRRKAAARGRSGLREDRPARVRDSTQLPSFG